MKICIVIQSDAFRTSAGMRIRYDRFAESLSHSGVSIDAITVGEISTSERFDHDVYIFCKTFDSVALLLARRLSKAGKIVGQDFFDDYFSQHNDSRLDRFRQWLRDMAVVTDFAICSTARMAEVVRDYLPTVPITTIEDPVAGFDRGRVAALADEKIMRARDGRRIDAVWFGIGDNPYFPVGLVDLANCDHELALMQRAEWEVSLRIVTNKRPFESTAGEVLRALSVGFEVVEWTEEVERQELERATVALIPVNGQSFSRAKSMNRAVTAIDAGCQVLSTQFPLYQQIDSFIYSSTDRFLQDLDAGAMRISSATIRALAARLTELADPTQAANAFAAAARRAMKSAPRSRSDRVVCVLHGRTSTIGVHKAVGALGGISASTIFSKAPWNFPVRFDRSQDAVVMRVTPPIAEKYRLPIDPSQGTLRISDFDFVEVNTDLLGVAPLLLSLPPQANPILDLSIYEDVMRFAQECCLSAFPAADILIADTSPFVRKPKQAPSGTSIQMRRHDIAGASSTRTNPLQMLKRRVAGAEAVKADRALALVRSSSLFHRQWYLETYPDVAASGIDPAEHYTKFGWQEKRDPSPAFSTSKYLKANPDVAERGLNPLVHYIEYGLAEGRAAPVVKAGKRR